MKNNVQWIKTKYLYSPHAEAEAGQCYMSYYYKCSKCGHKQDEETKYCSYCGSKMNV